MRARKFGLSALLLLVLAFGAHAATWVVTQTNIAFVPNDITIEVGDTVEWHWTNFSHTVTSGVDLNDPNAGLLFDAPLDAAHTIFSFTFTEAGDQPYFCRPHVLMGMTGIVRVQGPTAVPEDSLEEPASLSAVKNLY